MPTAGDKPNTRMDSQAADVPALGLELERDELLRLVASVSDALWTADVLGGAALSLRYVSPAIEGIAGWPAEYFVGTRGRWSELVEPSDAARRVAALGRLISGASDHEDVEYRIRRADGALRWVRDNIRAARLDRGRVVLNGVLSRIDERKSMEAKLREQEARFRSLAALSSDWYWRQDRDLRFTFLSTEVAALSGYRAEWSIGKTRWELPNLVPLTSSWEAHRAVVEAHQTFRDFEYCRVDPEGPAAVYRSKRRAGVR